MDKSWIDVEDIHSQEYITGFRKFLEFATKNWTDKSKIYCPCIRCRNRYLRSVRDVNDHYRFEGFHKPYKIWVHHGEAYASLQENQNDQFVIHSDSGGDVIGMLEDAMGMHIDRVDENKTSGDPRDQLPMPNEETMQFLKLLENAEKQLYLGCEEFTKLSFITHLMQLKVESN
ncbi:hypothetical protein ACH5RR_006349 [Cinchona calisaya]|uniref:Transposase-associated domain-containing protein n=1 Tax=Cinchona calisaya TaxID=153742 RepID=A0ABD3ANR3_9GENT